MSLSNQRLQIVVVTGVSGGLGSEIAQAYFSRGDIVCGIDIVPPVSKSELDFFQADITDAESMETVFAEIIRRYKQVDILINNAGIRPPATHFSDLTINEWRRVIEINLSGTFIVSQLAAKYMVNGGVIVNVASQLAYCVLTGHLAYGTSKAAIVQLTSYMSVELAADGIRVFGVAPGVIETSMTEQLRQDEAWVSARIGAIPAGRFATPKEIADFIADLTENRACYVRGTTVVVDGGYLQGLKADATNM